MHHKLPGGLFSKAPLPVSDHADVQECSHLSLRPCANRSGERSRVYILWIHWNASIFSFLSNILCLSHYVVPVALDVWYTELPYKPFDASKVCVSQLIVDALTPTPVQYSRSAHVRMCVLVCTNMHVHVCVFVKTVLQRFLEMLKFATSYGFTLQQVVYSEPPSNQPLGAIFYAFSTMILSKRSSLNTNSRQWCRKLLWLLSQSLLG